jgi:hypothetical protein
MCLKNWGIVMDKDPIDDNSDKYPDESSGVKL